MNNSPHCRKTEKIAGEVYECKFCWGFAAHTEEVRSGVITNFIASLKKQIGRPSMELVILRSNIWDILKVKLSPQKSQVLHYKEVGSDGMILLTFGQND